VDNQDFPLDAKLLFTSVISITLGGGWLLGGLVFGGGFDLMSALILGAGIVVEIVRRSLRRPRPTPRPSVPPLDDVL